MAQAGGPDGAGRVRRARRHRARPRRSRACALSGDGGAAHEHRPGKPQAPRLSHSRRRPRGRGGGRHRRDRPDRAHPRQRRGLWWRKASPPSKLRGTHNSCCSIVSVAVFSIEYLLRLWSAPEDPLARGTGKEGGRLRYALRPMMVIDFLAIAPTYVAISSPSSICACSGSCACCGCSRSRAIRRRSPRSRMSFRRSGERFSARCCCCSAPPSSPRLPCMRRRAACSPKRSAPFPRRLWWAIATLNHGGLWRRRAGHAARPVIAGMTMIAGLGLFALPVGIIATGFVQSIHRRDFVVTLGMLAPRPAFRRSRRRHAERSDESPASAACGRPERSSPRAAIRAHAFYLLISGEIEVELTSRALHFGPGTFFGELAFLHQTMRRAAIVALTQCPPGDIERRGFRPPYASQAGAAAAPARRGVGAHRSVLRRRRTGGWKRPGPPVSGANPPPRNPTRTQRPSRTAPSQTRRSCCPWDRAYRRRKSWWKSAGLGPGRLRRLPPFCKAAS